MPFITLEIASLPAKCTEKKQLLYENLNPLHAAGPGLPHLRPHGVLPVHAADVEPGMEELRPGVSEARLLPRPQGQRGGGGGRPHCRGRRGR